MIWLLPLLFAIFHLTHSSFLGMSDDEAYYWVLSQSPAWGYAFHPPGTAWWIALSEKILGVFGVASNHSVVVRMPAAVSSGLILLLALLWVERASEVKGSSGKSAWIILSFAGFSGAAWMMVPDIPLFLGLTLAFVSAWWVCFEEKLSRGQLRASYAGLALGVMLSLLGKFSGVFVGFSAATVTVLLMQDRRRLVPTLGAILAGGVFGLLPSLYWNATHEWGAFVYQFRERHSGSGISWIRYLRFWILELVFAGPAILYFFFWLLKRVQARDRLRDFVLIWALPPALVYCTQPLFSDFKPHWAFVVWLPVAFWMAASREAAGRPRLLRVQRIYGPVIALLAIGMCHAPLVGWVAQLLGKAPIQPTMDVANDLYGWKDLPTKLRESLGAEADLLPVIGSRYQTASQAAFALGGRERVTQIPLSNKEMDEWPDLGVTEGRGPAWPRLLAPVIYIADHRYREPPGFLGAMCREAGTYAFERWGVPSRTIQAWKCEPKP